MQNTQNKKNSLSNQEITLIQGNSGEIYELFNKGTTLGEDWSGSWRITESLKEDYVMKGKLEKNQTVFNNDSLVDEPLKKKLQIFEDDDEEIVLEDDIIEDFGKTLIIKGKILPIPLKDRYIFLEIRGIFKDSVRNKRIRVQKGSEYFSSEIDLTETVKKEANTSFIFNITPTISEKLEIKNYIIIIEVMRTTNNVVVFRKEIMHQRLKVLNQGFSDEL